ncbi:hypothetical protein ADUPG1_008617 [Aduncisulcus paluster]|uniref:Uncharacterized protein n=1 Tax=Aduncisulcus paluster TaxID=2918883 RepID=A0ABQ5KSL9_9EUKA|nr:hypothetical protein ADUPG1_008617 [Aduncisulcus paluster]
MNIYQEPFSKQPPEEDLPASFPSCYFIYLPDCFCPSSGPICPIVEVEDLENEVIKSAHTSVYVHTKHLPKMDPNVSQSMRMSLRMLHDEREEKDKERLSHSQMMSSSTTSSFSTISSSLSSTTKSTTSSQGFSGQNSISLLQGSSWLSKSSVSPSKIMERSQIPIDASKKLLSIDYLTSKKGKLGMPSPSRIEASRAFSRRQAALKESFGDSIGEIDEDSHASLLFPAVSTPSSFVRSPGRSKIGDFMSLQHETKSSEPIARSYGDSPSLSHAFVPSSVPTSERTIADTNSPMKGIYIKELQSDAL